MDGEQRRVFLMLTKETTEIKNRADTRNWLREPNFAFFGADSDTSEAVVDKEEL